MRHAVVLVLAGSFLVAISWPARGEEKAGVFSFPLIWEDATPGTATDISFLNVKPAGVNGRIVVKDGHFAESGTGKRIRFIGINVAGREAFPEHDEAEKFAAHLAKAGVNFVRLHNLDNSDPQGRRTLIDTKQPDTQHFSPSQVDKFEYLIAQLKKNGIYANVNLKIVRELTLADGAPAYPHPSKVFDRFDARWIELQKKWAQDLLTHVNPYTGSSLADDPAVLVVELSNENSIAEPKGGWGIASGLSRLPGFYRDELRTLWNKWLSKKYGDDTRLNAAWHPAIGALGPSALTSAHKWITESDNGTLVTLASANSSSQAIDAAPDVDVEVVKNDALDWHVQVHLTGLDMKEGETYTVSFRVKSEKPRDSRLSVGLDRSPWHNCGLNVTFESGPAWKVYQFPFVAMGSMFDPEHIRVSCVIGSSVGKISIADLRLRPGAPNSGEGSLGDGSLPVVEFGSAPQLRDWRDFIAELDRGFADGMRSFLKDTLGVKALIIDTQVDYGGPIGLYREAAMDFVDAHAYWQHPDYPGKEWDFANWTIGNTPQLDALRTGNSSVLAKLSAERVAGRPFSVSEYDQPAPSEYVSEMMPELVLVASLQDWDALYTFCQGEFGSSGGSKSISHVFDQTNHPGKFGFFPAAALIFRTGMIAPLNSSSVLSVPAKPWNAAGRIQQLWNLAPVPFATGILETRQSIAAAMLPEGSKPQIETAKLPEPENRTIKLSPLERNSILSAESPGCAMLIGSIGGQRAGTRSFGVEAGHFQGDFASFVLVALDGRPLESSERELLVMAGVFNNLGIKWNKARNSAARDQGGEWGTGIVSGAFIPATISVAASQPKIVYALDNCGRRAAQVDATWAAGKLTFSTAAGHETIWYELTAGK